MDQFLVVEISHCKFLSHLQSLFLSCADILSQTLFFFFSLNLCFQKSSLCFLNCQLPDLSVIRFGCLHQLCLLLLLCQWTCSHHLVFRLYVKLRFLILLKSNWNVWLCRVTYALPLLFILFTLMINWLFLFRATTHIVKNIYWSLWRQCFVETIKSCVSSCLLKIDMKFAFFHVFLFTILFYIIKSLLLMISFLGWRRHWPFFLNINGFVLDYDFGDYRSFTWFPCLGFGFWASWRYWLLWCWTLLPIFNLLTRFWLIVLNLVAIFIFQIVKFRKRCLPRRLLGIPLSFLFQSFPLSFRFNQLLNTYFIFLNLLKLFLQLLASFFLQRFPHMLSM